MACSPLASSAPSDSGCWDERNALSVVTERHCQSVSIIMTDCGYDPASIPPPCQPFDQGRSHALFKATLMSHIPSFQGCPSIFMTDTMLTKFIQTGSHPSELIRASAVSPTTSHLLSIGDVPCRGDGGVVKVFILIHPHFCCSPRVPEKTSQRQAIQQVEVAPKSKCGMCMCTWPILMAPDWNTFLCSWQFFRQRDSHQLPEFARWKPLTVQQLNWFEHTHVTWPWVHVSAGTSPTRPSRSSNKRKV